MKIKKIFYCIMLLVFIGLFSPVYSVSASTKISNQNTTNIKIPELNFFASEIIGMYSIDLYNDNGILKITSNLTSPYILDEISINIQLQELINGKWTNIAKFNGTKYDSYIYTYKNEYMSMPSSSYKAICTFSAKKDKTSDTKICESNILNI